MKKRKIIAKLMVLSMIISNVSGISVQATDNIDVQNDNSIQYNVDTENSETFEESNVDKNIIFNETVENDDLISNENEILKEMEEVEEINEQSLDSEINEEVNYDESEVISEEVTIISPMVSRAAAIGNVNILSSDSTTVAQAEAWARAKGATEEFVGLASLYQKYASSRGGVNWVLAYVQAAKETGYGKFGGVLDASYHNPCGLKNSSGGADEDPNAHKRFDNWDQGIIAHLDHLALYAGAAGYPKTNYVSKWQNSNLDSTSTYDPRHFPYLKGRATTVNDLGGQWAPSSTYGVEIFRLYCDLTGATYLSAKSNLEDPTENLIISDGKLRVKGWALHAFGVKQVDVYLDGRLLGNIQYGLERTDVYRFFPDYFNSNKSGFDTTFDITSVSNGNKKLEVIITANDGSKNTITRNITVNRLISRSNLDDPYGTADITSNTLLIRGWALSGSGVKSVEAFIDGASYGQIKYGVSRADVNKAYPGYSSGDNCGFEGRIDISKLSNGAKTLKVVITSNDGSTQTLTKSINIKRVTLQSRSNLDDPYGTADITSNTLLIRGWALSGSGVKSVEAFIDGTSYGQIKYGVSRADVNKVYPGYSSGDNCGFEGTIDISKLSDGTKTLKVVITSNDGSTQTLTKSIVIKDLIYNLEDPNDSYLYAPNGKLLVKGWALSKTGIKEISVSIDGKYYGTVDYGKIRPDVTKFYPNYINSGNSGFEKTFDLSDLTDGDKIITITVVSNNGSKSTITKTVKKVTLNSVCWLDDPIVDKQITDGKLVVNGWALNVSGTKEIRVKVDGNLVGKVTLNVTRTDVYNVYPEYGNKNSGYTGTFNISSLSSGNKKLLVEIEYNDGTVQVITRNFKLGKQKTVYIDAGHDYGGDMGAVRVINGVTYDETTLNIEVAEYLRTELINKGYEVIMARRIGERPTSNNYRESLWNRINAANNAKADFYISIHQNASTTTSANGVEAYYCSVKPDSLNDITYKLNTSKAVAASISSGIANALSMTNRGAKDDEFMVVKYTNMPAVLVECGFISNESDAKKISNATNQKKIASVIADSIHNALK